MPFLTRQARTSKSSPGCPSKTEMDDKKVDESGPTWKGGGWSSRRFARRHAQNQDELHTQILVMEKASSHSPDHFVHSRRLEGAWNWHRMKCGGQKIKMDHGVQNVSAL